MPNKTLTRKKDGTYTTKIKELPAETEQKKQVVKATDRPKDKQEKETTKTTKSPPTTATTNTTTKASS